MKKIRVLFTFLFFSLLYTLQAQVESSPPNNIMLKLDTVQIADVVIRDYRLNIPQSEANRDVQILTALQISELPVQTLSELLSYIAGVDVRRRGEGAQTDVQIFGGTFEQTLIMINGMKMTDTQTGHHSANLAIPIDAIEYVEVVKGAAAKSYGLNAMNGVINIITKTSFEDQAIVHTYVGMSDVEDTSRNRSFMNHGISVLGHVAGENGYTTIAASHDQSEGFIYNTSSEVNKIFVHNKHYLLKGSLLETQAGYVHNAFGANGFYASPFDKNSYETVQTAFASTHFTYYTKKYWIIKPMIGVRYNHDDYIFIKDNPSYYRNKHENTTWDALLNITKYTSLGTLGFGAEWQQSSIHSRRLGNHDRRNMGLYTEFHFTKLGKTSVTLGAFANHNTQYGWDLFPGIDIGYQANKKLKLFANANRAARVPSYTDLYYVGPSNLGNDSLQPENAYVAELGCKYQSTKWQAQVSYFYRNIHDFIDWSKTAISDPWQTENYGTLATQGLNANIRIPFQIFGTNKNYIQFQYTHLESKFTLDEKYNYSKYLIQSLRDQLIINTRISFTKKLSLSAAGRYVNRVHYKDYTLLDTKLEYTHGHFSCYLQSNNILDTSYEEAAATPMPGRWYCIGFRLK